MSGVPRSRLGESEAGVLATEQHPFLHFTAVESGVCGVWDRVGTSDCGGDLAPRIVPG